MRGPLPGCFSLTSMRCQCCLIKSLTTSGVIFFNAESLRLNALNSIWIFPAIYLARILAWPNLPVLRLHRLINRIDRLTDDMTDKVTGFRGNRNRLATSVKDLLGRYRKGEVESAPTDKWGRDVIQILQA